MNLAQIITNVTFRPIGLTGNLVVFSFELIMYRWPEGKMYIEIDPDLATNVIGVMHQALRELEKRSIIRFKAHDVETDYIKVFPGGGCTSMLGRMGGRQHISLANGCDGMA